MPTKISKNSFKKNRSEIRKHYFLDRYVVISPKRNLRPDSFAPAQVSHKLETTASPAIENDKAVYEIKDHQGAWLVKVINNAYPSLSLDNPQAYGKQEVIIETPSHNVEFSELTLEQISHVFDAYVARTNTLLHLPGIRYVVVFKNDGPAAGASIAHAHSQIVALPFVPPHLEREAHGIEKYVAEHGSCPYCDLTHWEAKQKKRVIFNNHHVMVIAPYASSSPFDAWIIPKVHAPAFRDLNHDQRQAIGKALKHIACKLDSAGISFNFFLQDSLPGHEHHFVLKVEPRGNTWGGFELATGVIFNPIPPEFAAEWYKSK